MIVLRSEYEIQLIRTACEIAGCVLEDLKNHVRPGITTKDLEIIARESIIRRGATPAFLGYKGYPANICASVNEEIVHGIPGKRKLKDGDIISLDVGVKKDGYYGDTALTVGVGNITNKARDLIEVTKKALEKGIEKARPENRLSDISFAVQSFVESQGFSVVRDFVGHGIGSKMHEDPQIPNFGRPDSGPKLKPGMVLAIEPMVNEGTYELDILKDGWTAVTKDRKLSAHFEHVVAITRDAPEILTVCQKKKQ